MSETNFFGLSRGHYDPLAGASRPLVVPQRSATLPISPSPIMPPARPATGRQTMDLVVKPEKTSQPMSIAATAKSVAPKNAPESTVLAASKTPSPVIEIDDLLNDFVEKKAKTKPVIKAKKARGPKLTDQLAARRQARRTKIETRRQARQTKSESRRQAKLAKPAEPEPIIEQVAINSGQTGQSDFTAQALTVAADTISTAQAPTTLAWNGGGETAAVTDAENVLDRLNQIPKVALDFKINKKRIFAFIRAMIIISILAVSGYLAWDTWVANRAAHQTFSNPVAAVAIDNANPVDADVTSVSNQAWATYTVPADQPRYLYLPTINLQARVMSVGVNSRGKIDAPKNVNDVAWYDGSAKPGQEGQVFINGYTSFAPTYKAAFDNLAKLQVGDHITIERGDGTKISYRVVKNETIAASKVNMQKVLNVPDNATSGLTLMSCTGKYDYRTQSSDKRVIVYAVQD